MTSEPTTSLAPTLVPELFPVLASELIPLLRSLEPADWDRPTVCPAWAVHDIAAHLLDSACRRLAAGRDGHLRRPDDEIADYGGLLRFLDRLNAEWVTAARRLSPRLLTDLLEWVEPQLAAYLASLDPWGEAQFPVAWAGDDSSRAWFDVARELTERWHHQQQIRLAVGARPLTAPEISRPIFDTFLRALPHRYRETAAAAGTAVVLAIDGEASYLYTLERSAEGWQLLAGAARSAAAEIRLDEQDAWLLLTKGLPGADARRRAEVRGDERLAAPFFATLAVMA